MPRSSSYPRYMKHGHNRDNARSGAYSTWAGIIQRCTNPKSTTFWKYGARGITVHPRWLSFESFLADMGDRPTGATIDRIDGSLGYAPGNCRWALPSQQQRNLKSNRIIEYRGQKKCLTDLSAEFGLNASAVHRRLARGWSLEEALTIPSKRPS